MVESALTLTVILFLLYGALELGLVGVDQLTVDGGAFAMAHQQSFQGGSQTYLDSWTLARSALPHLQAPYFSSSKTQIAPPPMVFNSQYNFGASNGRYGGVSLVQPVQNVVSILRSPLQDLVLGSTGSLSISGNSIEPTYRLINQHFNLSGNNFNTWAAFKKTDDPLSESTPPYFIGFNYLQTCSYQIAGNSVSGWATCPSLGPPTALGSAEFLDAHNWSRPLNGVLPSPQAVFWETRYHQSLYASISTQLAHAETLPAAAIWKAKQQILDPTVVGATVQCVYSFDNNNAGVYAVGNTGVGDPVFALHPDYTSATCIAP